MYSKVSSESKSSVASMRGAWVAGGPCWLSMCRNNEDSLQPAGVEKGDVREAPTGATKGNTNSDSASRTVVHKISVQDPVLVHGQAADHSFHVSHD